MVIAIILLAIIPLLLFLYLLYSEAPSLLQKANVQLTILLIIGSAGCGYLLSRRMIVSIIKLTKEARTITQGELKTRISTSENNEVNELAQYFNQVTDELERNIEDLSNSKKVLQNVLLRIGNAMASSQKIGNILELTIETLTNALSASSGTIMLLEKDKLKILVSYGIDAKRKQDLAITKGEGVSGWVVKERKAQNVSRTQQDRRFDVEVKMGLAHKTIISAPLLFKDKILGTISVHDKKSDDEFTDDDLILLGNLATQTAVAIENKRLNEDIERTYIETISALALAVEAKDPIGRGHIKRVKEYATKLAGEFKLDQETIRTLQDAAVLHDIGKIGIKDAILLKPTNLTAEEKRQMHRHAIIGENILKPIHSLSKVAYLVRHHQEQENGKGYPDGLTGSQMALSLKILIAADAFDAMTSARPYGKPISFSQAKKELKKYSGIYFDANVVEAFLNII